MGLFNFGNKKKMKKEQGETTEGVGSFVGFVLLSEPVWDKSQLIKAFIEDWGIDASESEETAEEEQYNDILLIEQGEMRLAISFMEMPVPNGEAEHYAGANYLWPDAVEVTKGHKAQILIAVLGENADLLERGKLFTKAVAVCLKQENAVGVYTDGMVFQPEFYLDFSAMLKEDELPIMNWVWFGIYHTEKERGIYTYGMKKFGKDEMEVYMPSEEADLGELRDFMSNMVSYVLENDVILQDGETIGFSAEQKLPITRSKGIALDGQTLKFGYER